MMPYYNVHTSIYLKPGVLLPARILLILIDVPWMQLSAADNLRIWPPWNRETSDTGAPLNGTKLDKGVAAMLKYMYYLHIVPKYVCKLVV